MESLTIASTSAHSADVITDFELWSSQSRRLVFRAQIVDNHNNPEESVRGHLIYQRKSKNDEWEDLNEGSLNLLKNGEGIKHELKSEPTRKLFLTLQKLYSVYDHHGVQTGTNTYLQLSQEQFESLSALDDASIDSIVSTDGETGVKLLHKLLKWASRQTSADGVQGPLTEVSQTELNGLSSIAGIATLKKVLEIWNDNETNDDEEFWQKTLVRYQFLLEHVSSMPITVVKGKAFLGGKNYENTGGNIVDFLMKNSLTGNAALVEIKTPTTRLLGGKYRGGVYNASSELTGSTVQILNYRHSYNQNHHELNRDSPENVSSFEPPCFIIIGNSSELFDNTKKRSFELYRNGIHGVTVLTFDEVFTRAKKLLNLLTEHT